MVTAPIGIFDSGMGGLTIVKAINAALPNENIIYFGDTLHTPWGDKSKAAIKHYAIKICDFLLQHNCKIIVIACHTASAVIYKDIQQHARNIPVINVIDPVVDFVCAEFSETKVGIIGTKQTIASNNYLKKVQAKNKAIKIKALATALLVPLIEEGLADALPTKLVLEMYLADPQLQDIQALILGCTHYPLIKQQIQNFYKNKISIIDATKLTVISLQQKLTELNLINPHIGKAEQNFYISDHNPHFIKLAKLFFQHNINLSRSTLWNEEI